MFHFEFIRTNKNIYPGGMIYVLADGKHKRLHNRLAVIGGVDFLLAFGILMAGNAVLQHHLAKLFVIKIVKVNVRVSDGKRRSGVAFLNRLGERIFIHDILKGTCLLPGITSYVVVSSTPHSGCSSFCAAAPRSAR